MIGNIIGTSIAIIVAIFTHHTKPIKMAKKKNNSKKPIAEKSTMIKIAEKVGELAGRIVNEKDHLVEMAGGAIDSVKTAVQHITASTKKATVKKAAKKAVKKVAKKVEKKIKPAVKKVKKVASTVKKAASPKKAASVKKDG